MEDQNQLLYPAYILNENSRHNIARFKVTAKPYSVETRTAEPRRAKAAELAA
jgi:hypothetical protein